VEGEVGEVGVRVRVRGVGVGVRYGILRDSQLRRPFCRIGELVPSGETVGGLEGSSTYLSELPGGQLLGRSLPRREGRKRIRVHGQGLMRERVDLGRVRDIGSGEGGCGVREGGGEGSGVGGGVFGRVGEGLQLGTKFFGVARWWRAKWIGGWIRICR
jgi:hypothetical protein